MGYARFLLTTVVLVTGSAADSTTAASPSALESVTGSRLITARLAGMTVVRSSTITSRFWGERLLRELAFFVFLLVVVLLAIQTSQAV
jgi:hypothetical protein